MAALLLPHFGFPAVFSRKYRENQLWEQQLQAQPCCRARADDMQESSSSQSRLFKKEKSFSPLCCYVTAPNKQEGDPAKVPNLPDLQTFPGLGDLPAGALGLGVLWGPACSPALHCKQTKNSHGMLLTLCWVSRDSLVHLPSSKRPQFQYPASALAFAGFFPPGFTWFSQIVSRAAAVPSSLPNPDLRGWGAIQVPSSLQSSSLEHLK